MPLMTLPDGSQRNYPDPVTVLQVAEDIGPGLARVALAGKANGQLVDLSHTLNEDTTLAIVTAKDEEGLEIIRHSTAHLLAHAVKQLYPDAQVTIGPVIDDGFFYDFAYPAGFTPEDMARIETRMKELAKQKITLHRNVMPRDEAISFFKDQGEHYKAEIIADLPEDEVLTLYEQAEFTDLCRGPHVPDTGKLKAFKLTKLAGAYWRGDSKNEMLQRVYGTAWPDKDALKAYLKRIEEAERRDHRKLAKKMKLFHFQPEAPGMVFWHPNGWRIYEQLQQFLRKRLEGWGYQEIRTPQLVDVSLWERSGHLAKFADDMFLVEADDRNYAIKPMNCPCHIQVFNHGLHSYRDLPLRFAEFGCCHRNEPSGALHGLLRVRQMMQDDGHIFCTHGQIESEVAAFIKQTFETYEYFGFKDISVKLSTRPEKRVGEDAIWDQAEKALSDALNHCGVEWEEQPGEGAFYGPKVEFNLRDCIGRVWQCGTIQLDFFMPERLGAHYIDEDSKKQTPVMLHRAMLGSLERFIAILIEETEGNLPLWLAPQQVVIMNITDAQAEYSAKIAKSLKKLGIRAETDLRNEKIGYKIREHTIKRVPYLVVVGDKEVEHQAVAVRTQAGEDLGSLGLDAFIDRLSQELVEVGG